MIENYDEIIISSGGNKGIALIGALNEFNKNYPIYNIKYFTGCSVGSLISLIIILGYSIDELNEILFGINFSLFQDLKLLNLIEKCGLDEGRKFSNFIKALMIQKNFNPNITYNELYIITNKILTITVTNISKGISEYHNYINTPNMNVFLSVRMSLNIPILFSPILYNNDYYVDGALLDPFPYYYNKNKNKFGLCLFEKNEYYFINNINVRFINDLSDSFNYITNLLKIIYTNYMKKYYKKIPKNTIYLNFNYNPESIESFDVSLAERKKIFNIGLHKCQKFFNIKNKKIRKKYLEKKYFYLWFKKIKNKFS